MGSVFLGTYRQKVYEKRGYILKRIAWSIGHILAATYSKWSIAKILVIPLPAIVAVLLYAILLREDTSQMVAVLNAYENTSRRSVHLKQCETSSTPAGDS